MKKSTRYLLMALGLWLGISCANNESHYVPLLPEDNPKEEPINRVRVALDASPLPPSTRSSAPLPKGYFFLVKETTDGMKLVETVSFDQKDLEAGGAVGGATVWYLNLSLRAKAGEYLALVLLNPTADVETSIKNNAEPWLATAEFKEAYLTVPGGLANVMTNIVANGKPWTKENLYPKFTLGTDEGVVIPVGRVLSKIQMEGAGAVIKGASSGCITASRIEIKDIIDYYPFNFFRDSFGLLNIPNKFYLWPQLDENQMPYSYYEGDSNKDNMVKNTLHYVSFINRPPYLQLAGKWESHFYKNSIYIPENIATVAKNGRYEAKRGAASAIIIRFTGSYKGSSRLKSYYLGYADKHRYISPYSVKVTDSKEEVVYNNGMFLYFYIEDPNHSLNVGNKKRSYPSVFRNTNYRIVYSKVLHIGTNVPATNLTPQGPTNKLEAATFYDFNIFPNGDSYSLHSHRPGYNRSLATPVSDPIITTE